MSAKDQVNYSREPADTVDELIERREHDANYISALLTGLALGDSDREMLAAAFTHGDHCEMGRIIDAMIYDYLVEEAHWEVGTND